MDSFHAHRIVAEHPLPIVHNNVYPMLFKAAFQDRKHLALQDLVATWPCRELNFLQLVEHQELVLDRNNMVCIEAIIQAVVSQLRQELEEPDNDSRCQLRVLDMTGVQDDPNRLKFSLTKALSKACLEVSRHQQELQRHRSKRRKGCSGATTAAPQLQGVVIHVDLRVSSSSFTILRKVLQTGAAGLLHIKCRDFQAENISATQIVTLLESLDPSCLRRVHLWSDSFEWKDLSEIMPHLSRFPELHSLVIQLDKIDLRSMTPELAMRIRGMAAQLGMLRGLRELSLGMIELSGNLHRFLCDLQAPLESLDLGSCSLVPADLTFLSQSIHAPALKRLVLNGNNISRGLLEPLQRLLEKASASLLLLDLSCCDIADSHLAVLLPTLLRCSRLRFLGLNHNPLSMAALKNLLQKTLELPHLHEVLYPHPVDCSRPEDFTWHCLTYEERLAAAEKVFSQILANSGRTDFVWNSSIFVDIGPDYFFL